MVAFTTQEYQLLPIVLSEKQQEFMESTAWVRGFVAGRGSGKTVIGARAVLLTAKNRDPWMSVSPSYGIVHETTLPTFIDEAERMGLYVRHVKSPLPRVTFRTWDGGLAEIVFRSGEDPEKLRGPSKAGLWIDEASITHVNVFLIGMAVLRHKGVMGPLVLTFTPKGRRHWSFEAFFDRYDLDTFCQLSARDDGLYCTRRDPFTGREATVRLYEFGGMYYVRKANSHLVHAKTTDNPFLPADFFTNIRQHYGAQLAAQELGGEFVDVAGLLFKREWFQLVNDVPRDCRRVRYWDRAATPGAGDYSAGVLLARDPRGIWYLEDVVRGQWSPFERNTIMKQTAARDAARYNNEVIVYVEQEPGSGGKEVALQAVLDLAGVPVYSDLVRGRRQKQREGQNLPGEAKIVRARPFAAQCENGNVRMKQAPWNADYLDEMCSFPEYAHDDQVDASSGAFNKLAALTGFVADSATRTIVGAQNVAEEKYGIQLQRTRRRRSLPVDGRGR